MAQIGVHRLKQREITELQDSHKDLHHAFAFHVDSLKATHLPERTSLLIGKATLVRREHHVICRKQAIRQLRGSALDTEHPRDLTYTRPKQRVAGERTEPFEKVAAAGNAIIAQKQSGHWVAT